ncbi:MAG: ABC transporter ATP-binding protein [Propionibacteriaceae bacterium]|jgi:ABC-2 type transport system ATP-binding protein|nr:ABC transporter ATP-binding protein [Propionibacteriaceae bacterium]
MTAVVELSGVSKRFRGLRVLEDVDLTVSRGECLAITGPNGSGKSVLFKIMCRFVAPDSGRVVIDPAYLDGKGVFPSGFGVIIDRPRFISNETGRDNLLELARIRRVVGPAEVDAAMERVGLDPDQGQHVGQYSLGMKQKLALAQAFMEGQPVLLLDEPFNALDEASCAAVHQLLREFLEEGRTIVFTSHNPDDVAALATRQCVIQDRHLFPAPGAKPTGVEAV